jgi:hypothetical protein
MLFKPLTVKNVLLDMFFLFFLIVSISWFNMFSLHCHSFIPHGVGLHLYQLFTVNPVLSLRISLEGMVLRSNNPWSGTLDGCCASAALNIIQPAQITILTFYINVVMNICVGKKGGVIRIVIFVVFFLSNFTAKTLNCIGMSTRAVWKKQCAFSW